MKRVLCLVLPMAFAASTYAVVTATVFGPGQWFASDATLGVSGATIADFESVNLPLGLQISVSTPNGGYGPSSTIPQTFNPITDDPFGTVFIPGVWDGSRSLISTRTNRPFNYFSTPDWGGTTSFHFAGGTDIFGVSIQQADINFSVQAFDANNQLIFSSTGSTLGMPTSGDRQGYLRLNASGGDVISKVALSFAPGDGLTFDHVAFRAVPEPGTMTAFGVAGLMGWLARRRKRTN